MIIRFKTYLSNLEINLLQQVIDFFLFLPLSVLETLGWTRSGPPWTRSGPTLNPRLDQIWYRVAPSIIDLLIVAFYERYCINKMLAEFTSNDNFFSMIL